ncbi:uncharacterized protein LOC115883532 [Sitophilus oryzae]|uniref:Uncharacterized protein LOC115883532 n=1 Tax=Sitophilus oryzae TaxID=7048 RepID=A0A6J2Y3C4_SITOR|nr:uncharacterized protein LOC115883532 [Sitophilus oryzae]
MYAAGEHITLQTLQANLQNIDDVQLSLTMLGKRLKYLQFIWQSCKHSNRKYLMEQPYIAQKRLQFLRQYKENQISDCSFRPVFLDETWIYSKGGFKKSWQDGSLQTVRKTSGEGVRYIVLHAGSEDGFVENASLVFKSGTKSGDYHDSMNSANFEKWFEEQLIPNLDEPSLIIMDNAPYHSTLFERTPNQSWSKESLINFLQEKGIQSPPLAMKDQVWNIVKQNVAPKKYKLDELANEKGHRVLRLPPYHCQYNPIEMVWSECKRYYDAKISAIHPVTSDAVLGLWKEALKKVTPEKWKNYIRHTNSIIDKAWAQEQLIDASDILPVIIDTNDSDSDDNYLTEGEESV